MTWTRRSFLAAATTFGVAGAGVGSASARPTTGTHAAALPAHAGLDIRDPFSQELANPAPQGFTPLSPLPRAHAHNDYLHTKPLWDALGQGFTSVEADIWFRDGALLLGHTFLGTLAGRSIEKWYIQPLAAWVRAHNGEVFPGWGGTFQLLIDIKDQGAECIKALEAMLANYADILWSIKDGVEKPGPVRVVYTGTRPGSALPTRGVRFGSLDGHLGDLTNLNDPSAPLGAGAVPPEIMPLYSESWTTWGWQGFGAMPADQWDLLARFTESAHAHGGRARLWGVPEVLPERRKVLWQMQLNAGIDLISTDYLPELRAFLVERGYA